MSKALDALTEISIDQVFVFVSYEWEDFLSVRFLVIHLFIVSCTLVKMRRLLLWIFSFLCDKIITERHISLCPFPSFGKTAAYVKRNCIGYG